MSTLVDKLFALVVSATGLALAVIVYSGHWPFVLGILALLLLAGAAATQVGRRHLGNNKIVKAIVPLETAALLVQGTKAAVGGLLAIFIAVEAAGLATTDEETKAVVAAGSAAVLAFVTATLLEGADSPDDNWIGSSVKRALQKALSERVHALRPPGGTATGAELALESNLWREGGWGDAMRRARAAEIEAALGAVPPATG